MTGVYCNRCGELVEGVRGKRCSCSATFTHGCPTTAGGYDPPGVWFTCDYGRPDLRPFADQIAHLGLVR